MNCQNSVFKYLKLRVCDGVMIILINISRLRSNCGESGAYSATAETSQHTDAAAASLNSGSWAQLLHIVRMNVTIRRSSVIPLLL